MAKKFLDADGLKTVWGQVKKLDEQNMAMHIDSVEVDSAAETPSIVNIEDEEGKLVGRKIVLPSLGSAGVEADVEEIDDRLTVVESMLNKSLTKMSLNVSPSQFQRGVSTNVTVTISGTYNDVAVTAADIKNAVISKSSNYSNPINVDSAISASDTISDTTNYYAKATIKGVELTKTISSYGRLHIYYGASGASVMTAEIAKTLTDKGLVTTVAGDYNITTAAGDYQYIIYPASMSIKSTKYNDGLGWPYDGDSTVVIDGQSYKVARSAGTQQAGTNKITLS